MLDKKDVAVYTDKRQGDVQKSYADTKYAKKVLNFQAMTILSEGIKKTKAFYDDYKE